MEKKDKTSGSAVILFNCLFKVLPNKPAKCIIHFAVMFDPFSAHGLKQLMQYRKYFFYFYSNLTDTQVLGLMPILGSKKK